MAAVEASWRASDGGVRVLCTSLRIRDGETDVIRVYHVWRAPGRRAAPVDGARARPYPCFTTLPAGAFPGRPAARGALPSEDAMASHLHLAPRPPAATRALPDPACI